LQAVIFSMADGVALYDAHVKEQCLNSGMDQVLTKPVNSKDLLAAVETCL
jgi:CheY-like chemotaxis protein